MSDIILTLSLSLSRFNIMSLSIGDKIGIFGKKHTGKTVLLKRILTKHSDIPNRFMICSYPEHILEYQRFIPKQLCYCTNLEMRNAREIQLRITSVINRKEDKRKILVNETPLFEESPSRLSDTMEIVVSQSVKRLCINQFDYVFLFKGVSYDRDHVFSHDELESFSLTNGQFKQLCDQIWIEPYTCVVLDRIERKYFGIAHKIIE